MPDDSRRSDEEWRGRLTPEQFEVTRRQGTEPAFSGQYWDCVENGMYRCVCCGYELFDSGSKFESGTGWPSFYEAVAGDRVRTRDDLSHGMRRAEVICGRCDAHLGHLFDDGPRPPGERFCINSAALDLDRKK